MNPVCYHGNPESHTDLWLPKCSHLTDYGPLDRLLDFGLRCFFLPSFFNSLAATHDNGCSRCLRGQIFWFQGKYFVFDTVKWAAVTLSSLVFLFTKYIFFFLSSRVENSLFLLNGVKNERLNLFIMKFRFFFFQIFGYFQINSSKSVTLD